MWRRLTQAVLGCRNMEAAKIAISRRCLTTWRTRRPCSRRPARASVRYAMERSENGRRRWEPRCSKKRWRLRFERHFPDLSLCALNRLTLLSFLRLLLSVPLSCPCAVLSPFPLGSFLFFFCKEFHVLQFLVSPIVPRPSHKKTKFSGRRVRSCASCNRAASSEKRAPPGSVAARVVGCILSLSCLRAYHSAAGSGVGVFSPLFPVLSILVVFLQQFCTSISDHKSRLVSPSALPFPLVD